MEAPRTGSEQLDPIAAGLEEAGWAAYILDSEWRFVWVSSELKALVGESDPDRLGLGEHTLIAQARPVWELYKPEVERDWLLFRISLILADTDKTRNEVAELATELLEKPQHRERANAIREQIRALSPLELPAWTFRLPGGATVSPELGGIVQFGSRLRDPEGSFLGVVELFVNDVPATLATALTRGNRAMYERMSRLSDPGRREAAIVFGDLERSADLARHLPSATYFDLIRSLTSEVDRAVAEAGGVVGRHAGDGVTAFFLAESLGSPAAASYAAVQVGVRLNQLASEIAEMLGLDGSSISLNVGLHWGATVYMGQLTGGRLEVTALGDEVNECARVQESARGGSILATKDVLERLEAAAAAELGIDLDAITYTTIAELETASEKAVRDAGGLAVSPIGRSRG